MVLIGVSNVMSFPFFQRQFGSFPPGGPIPPWMMAAGAGASPFPGIPPSALAGLTQFQQFQLMNAMNPNNPLNRSPFAATGFKGGLGLGMGKLDAGQISSSYDDRKTLRNNVYNILAAASQNNTKQ